MTERVRGPRPWPRPPLSRAVAAAAVVALLLLPAPVPGADPGLEGKVRRLVAAYLESEPGPRGARVAVAVLSESGETVVGIQAREPVKPASNLKVLTTAAALHHLGLDHQFETTIRSTAPIQDGTIAGALVVRGTGDPNISARFHGGDPEALFARWARRLRSLGLRRVDGDLIADDTFFDGVRFPPAWDRRQEEAWYAAQVSALSLNDNCLDITVRPAAGPGLPARVDAAPLSPAIDLEASVRTVAQGQPHIVVRRKPGTNRITVEGTIRAGSAPWSGNITIDDPALFFAHSLARVFAREGITIAGQVRKLARAAGDVPGGGSAAAGAVGGAAGGAVGSAAGKPAAAGVEAPVLLVRHTSTLAEDLPIINKRSQNLHAELLLRALGAKAGGEGSIEGGRRAVKSFLRARGIAEDGLEIEDGSGLSHENRVSAHVFARVLHAVRSEPYFAAFLASLPRAGEDGTLSERFASYPALRGHVFAKTGYIAGVSSLSGYVERGSRHWSFSILVNGLHGGSRGAKRLQERIAAAIHEAMGE